jgi:eukaryotic-like serine/threonine-protein kinase
MSNDRDNILSEIFDDALTLDNADKVSDLSTFEELEMNSEHYSNLEFFQQGGSKIIYKAYDTRTERKVALAQLPEEATELQVEAFLREARINAMLQHPNIVPVYDLGLRQSKPYFCMKFIDGKTLTDYIENSSDSNSDLLDVFLKICDATAYAHDRGILHLDLKPDNIRIDDFGDLRVCDWGLAQIIDGNEKIDKNFQKLEKYSFNKVDLDHKTIDGFIKGTPSFMAPEQTGLCKISKGPCTDTYALGCLLYFMLTKEQAFKGSLKDILDNTMKGIFPKPSKISPKVSSRIEAICLKAMSSDVEKRYQSVNEFKDDILAYRNGYITTAEEVNLFRLTKLFLKRNYLLSAIVFGFIIVMMISIFIFIKSLKDSEEQALSAKNQAIKSKGKAVKLAAEYLREKEENEAKGELLSEQFLENYKVAYEKYEFEDALEYINSAVKLNPANKEAWLSKADLHCIRFEFKEALNAYDQAGQEGTLFGLASKYASFEGPVSVNLKLELISEAVKQFKLHRPSSDFVHSEVYSDLSIEDRVAFVKGVFSIFNPK